jgi:hypothetical protein
MVVSLQYFYNGTQADGVVLLIEKETMSPRYKLETNKLLILMLFRDFREFNIKEGVLRGKNPQDIRQYFEYKTNTLRVIIEDHISSLISNLAHSFLDKILEFNVIHLIFL